METPSNPAPKVTMWSASSWATWKTCPLKWKIKSEKWANPHTKSDTRMAVFAVPGLVVDRLFELWLHRRDFEDFEWFEDNFKTVWRLVESKYKPKWTNEDEVKSTKLQTWRSLRVLFDLLHKHELLNETMGIQTEYHELIDEGISIAGAIDLWTVRPDGKLIVVDFKNFGSNTHRSIDQLHFGAMALERILGSTPAEAAYVCFHPSYAGYRKVPLRAADRNKLMARLKRATKDRVTGKCPAKYSAYSCPRWCEVRFACDHFLSRSGLKDQIVEEN